jgi:hypothetical protein
VHAGHSNRQSAAPGTCMGLTAGSLGVGLTGRQLRQHPGIRK